MSQALDPAGPAPETRSVRFRVLLFGACAAPLFWLGQVMLGYGVTARLCYPGDHPQALGAGDAVSYTLILFDAVALFACVAGGIVSWRVWRAIREHDRAHNSERQFTAHLSEARTRFLALWGVMSSLWFFAAILFNTIASVTVPPCLS